MFISKQTLESSDFRKALDLWFSEDHAEVSKPLLKEVLGLTPVDYIKSVAQKYAYQDSQVVTDVDSFSDYSADSFYEFGFKIDASKFKDHNHLREFIWQYQHLCDIFFPAPYEKNIVRGDHSLLEGKYFDSFLFQPNEENTQEIYFDLNLFLLWITYIDAGLNHNLVIYKAYCAFNDFSFSITSLQGCMEQYAFSLHDLSETMGYEGTEEHFKRDWMMEKLENRYTESYEFWEVMEDLTDDEEESNERIQEILDSLYARCFYATEGYIFFKLEAFRM